MLSKQITGSIYQAQCQTPSKEFRVHCLISSTDTRRGGITITFASHVKEYHLRLRLFSVYHLGWNFDPCMPSPRTQAWPQNLGSLLHLHGIQPGALLLNITLLSGDAELTLLIWKLYSSTLIRTQWFLLLNSALLHVTVVFKSCSVM